MRQHPPTQVFFAARCGQGLCTAKGLQFLFEPVPGPEVFRRQRGGQQGAVHELVLKTPKTQADCRQSELGDNTAHTGAKFGVRVNLAHGTIDFLKQGRRKFGLHPN